MRSMLLASQYLDGHRENPSRREPVLFMLGVRLIASCQKGHDISAQCTDWRVSTFDTSRRFVMNVRCAETLQVSSAAASCGLGDAARTIILDLKDNHRLRNMLRWTISTQDRAACSEGSAYEQTIKFKGTTLLYPELLLRRMLSCSGSRVQVPSRPAVLRPGSPRPVVRSQAAVLQRTPGLLRKICCSNSVTGQRPVKNSSSVLYRD